MIKKGKPIAHGHHSITPYLIVTDALDALHFYHVVFDAEELMRLTTLEGKIAHAEILIGDSHVILADEFAEMNMFAPIAFGGSAVILNLYVEDVDRVFKIALDNGAKIFRALQNQVNGDRAGIIIDPFGHLWALATHIEDVSAEELEKRFLDLNNNE
jgi:PhnB protein